MPETCFCDDCKWFSHTLLARLLGDDPKCSHPHSRESGHSTYMRLVSRKNDQAVSQSDCVDARRSEAMCGKRGHLWEPKQW